MRYRLEELFDLQMGKTPARANLDYWNGTNKWVSISDLSSYDKYVTDTNECISDLGVSESGIKVVPKNTVIMSFKLSIGKTAITTEEVYTNEAIMAFIDKGICEINTDYLYYLFSGTDWNKGTNKAVLGLTLNKATLSKKEIDIPDLHTQNEVVKKLDALSNVIQLQKHSLDKLDELIKSRFVEMFGDETNPQDLPVVNVEDVADVSVGVVIKPAQYYTDSAHGVKAFRSLNIGSMRIMDSDWVYFSQEGNERNAKSQLKENDLLVVRSGAPGTSCVVTKQYEGCNAIDIIIARPYIAQINPYYLCTYTNMPHGKRQIVEGTSGAAQQHFNVGKYNKLRVMLPSIELQNRFVDIINQIDKSKLVVKKSIDKLETLKKSLMQEYFG